MSKRGMLGLLVIGAIALGLYARHPQSSPKRTETIQTARSLAGTGCPLPPVAAPHAAPLQSPVPESLRSFAHPAATLTPIAGFSVDGRVLSRRDYRADREALLSPIDLALGWGRMRDDSVLDRLTISQRNRWYYYRWRGSPPIPSQEIVNSSANIHLIPADPAITRALREVQTGERVRIDGWLVNAQTEDGWRWLSSTSRGDTGKGACEVVYVCAIKRFDE